MEFKAENAFPQIKTHQSATTVREENAVYSTKSTPSTGVLGGFYDVVNVAFNANWTRLV